MFQDSEVIALVVALVGSFLTVFVLARRSLPQLHPFYAGFFLIVAASIFTVAEGVLWGDALNFLEHLSYPLAGLAFTLGAWRLRRGPAPPPGTG